MKIDGDIGFVEAANGTNDRYLATEDSDYSEEIRTMLRETPGVGVVALHYQAALDLARKQ